MIAACPGQLRAQLACLAVCLMTLCAATRGAERQNPPSAQSASPDQVNAGQTIFAAQCGFCHGRDATGGQTGPDLIESALVAADVRGDKMGPLVRSGRPDKGMPPFSLSDPDLAAVVAYIHSQKTKLDAQPGRRRRVTEADLLSGNVEAGQQYFNGVGGCARCHSPSGDLVGVATRFKGLALLQQMLYPRATPSAPTTGQPQVTVTLPTGSTVTGKLAYRDEFTIALTDAGGWYRSWPTSRVKFTVTNALSAHIEQLAKYTDDDMHNVFAYLQSVK